MAQSTSTLSQTLQSITATKIEELEKQRQSYEERKASILDAANPDEVHDLRTRIATLHDGVKSLNLASAAEVELDLIRRWLAQSKYDPSVPRATLAKFEDKLRSFLDVHSRKLSLADLYSRLLIEWIESGKTERTDKVGNGDDDGDAPSSAGGDASGEDFEVVQEVQEARLQILREKFEKGVFEPLEKDETEIDLYLMSLFAGDENTKVLEKLRQRIRSTGEQLLKEQQPMDRANLKRCIKSLLKNGLLDQEKVASLREFLRDDTVLDEITDVLNLRYANLQNWSWNAGSKGIPVVPRQSLNGKWRVVIDEDVLDAIHTHWIGHKWTADVKWMLQDVMHSVQGRSKDVDLPEAERAKWSYFLDRPTVPRMPNLERYRQRIYDDHFFLAPMPSSAFEEAFDYDNAGDSEDDEEAVNGNDPGPEKISGRELKQLLLRTLSTEMLVRRSLDGEAALVQSDFQWFSTKISHDTILAVLRFVGFQEEWITFFKKVVSPPLDMLTGGPVRTRERGLPMAHIMEKLFGELLLFFMDFAVKQEAGLRLYRFHDDLWLCGEPDKCAKAWNTMREFAKVMGLEFNQSKTGSVYIVDGTTNEKEKKKPEIVKTLPEGPVKMDFLVLDPVSGEWNVDKEHVSEHVKQLQKQLSATKSALEWVTTWNSCIGRFFSFTFGEPANCFGRGHLDTILEVHKQIQAVLFSGDKGNSVTEYLSRMISERFNVHDVPDAFFYMPESLGGLGLRNPFVSLFLVSENLIESPKRELRKCLDQERQFYLDAKREFEKLSEYERRRRFRKSFHDSIGRGDDDGGGDGECGTLRWENAHQFPSFEEFIKYREVMSPFFLDTYVSLVSKAETKEMPLPKRIQDALPLDPVSNTRAPAARGRWGQRGGFGRRGGGGMTGGSGRPQQLASVELDQENKWLVNFYADELLEKCGSLRIVEKSFLPLGVLKAMRNRKVVWQM